MGLSEEEIERMFLESARADLATMTSQLATLQSQVEQLRGELETVSRDRDYIKIYWGGTREALKEEKLIVDRVWKALGITTFEQAKPLSIDEHVESIIKERDQLRAVLRKCVAAVGLCCESLKHESIFLEDYLKSKTHPGVSRLVGDNHDAQDASDDALATSKPLLNKP